MQGSNADTLKLPEESGKDEGGTVESGSVEEKLQSMTIRYDIAHQEIADGLKKKGNLQYNMDQANGRISDLKNDLVKLQTKYEATQKREDKLI